MQIRILVFGVVKEIAAASSFEVAVDDHTNVKQLRMVLEKKFPKLATISSYRLAVNNEFAVDETTIHENDEIAIIPPVSGG
jgi:molybdopterin converting factor subunit 1